MSNRSGPQPHIVIFLSDQHRRDVAGCYGSDAVRTPAMDALAETGCLFETMYCNAPVCGPSRMSMLTGRLPLHNGVISNRHALASHIPTVAHALAAAGYDTVLCGRMHFIGPDQSHGFAERLVGDIGPTDPGFREGERGRFNHSTGQGREMLAFSGPGSGPCLAYDREVTAAACARMAAQPADRPLFLVVGTYSPHNPYVCGPEAFARCAARLPVPDAEGLRAKHARAHPGLRAWLTAREMLEVPPEALHRSQAAYCGMVEESDALIGEMADAVDRHLGRQNSVFIYTSDHGDLAGEHGMFWKSNFLEGAVGVPFLVRGPGFPAGGRIPGVCSLLDLAPTLTELAGAPDLPGAEGISLLPALRGGTLPASRAAVSVLLDPRTGPSIMIRKEHWKWVRYARYPGDQWADLREGDLWDETPEPCPLDVSQDLPAAWDPEALEQAQREIAAGTGMIRKAAEAQQMPPPDQWQADPAAFSLDEDT